MQGSKSWYASRTMWAGIVSMVTGLAGVVADTALQADTADWFVQLVLVLAGGWTLYGRWKATRIIK